MFTNPRHNDFVGVLNSEKERGSRALQSSAALLLFDLTVLWNVLHHLWGSLNSSGFPLSTVQWGSVRVRVRESEGLVFLPVVVRLSSWPVKNVLLVSWIWLVALCERKCFLPSMHFNHSVVSFTTLDTNEYAVDWCELRFTMRQRRRFLCSRRKGRRTVQSTWGYVCCFCSQTSFWSSWQ